MYVAEMLVNIFFILMIVHFAPYHVGVLTDGERETTVHGEEERKREQARKRKEELEREWNKREEEE